METLLVFAFGALFLLWAIRGLFAITGTQAPAPTIFDIVYCGAVGIWLILKSSVLS